MSSEVILAGIQDSFQDWFDWLRKFPTTVAISTNQGGQETGVNPWRIPLSCDMCVCCGHLNKLTNDPTKLISNQRISTLAESSRLVAALIPVQKVG